MESSQDRTISNTSIDGTDKDMTKWNCQLQVLGSYLHSGDIFTAWYHVYLYVYIKHHQLVGLLHKAADWKMIVDLQKQLQFPQDIVETRLTSDMVLLSQSTKQLVLIELNVPWEERTEEAHERKRLKYELLVEQCRAKGWSTRCGAIEVGCRGFLCQSLWNTFRTFEIVGTARKKATCSISEVFKKFSRWLWSKRAESWESK